MLALARESNDIRYRDFCIKQRALPQWRLDCRSSGGGR